MEFYGGKSPKIASDQSGPLSEEPEDGIDIRRRPSVRFLPVEDVQMNRRDICSPDRVIVPFLNTIGHTLSPVATRRYPSSVNDFSCKH